MVVALIKCRSINSTPIRVLVLFTLHSVALRHFNLLDFTRIPCERQNHFLFVLFSFNWMRACDRHFFYRVAIRYSFFAINDISLALMAINLSFLDHWNDEMRSTIASLNGSQWIHRMKFVTLKNLGLDQANLQYCIFAVWKTNLKQPFEEWFVCKPATKLKAFQSHLLPLRPTFKQQKFIAQ